MPHAAALHCLVQPLCTLAQDHSDTCWMKCLLSEVWMWQYALWTLSNSKSNQEHPGKKGKGVTKCCLHTYTYTYTCSSSSSQTTRWYEARSVHAGKHDAQLLNPQLTETGQGYNTPNLEYSTGTWCQNLRPSRPNKVQHTPAQTPLLHMPKGHPRHLASGRNNPPPAPFPAPPSLHTFTYSHSHRDTYEAATVVVGR